MVGYLNKPNLNIVTLLNNHTYIAVVSVHMVLILLETASELVSMLIL